jgi:hypothetical protein
VCSTDGPKTPSWVVPWHSQRSHEPRSWTLSFELLNAELIYSHSLCSNWWTFIKGQGTTVLLWTPTHLWWWTRHDSPLVCGPCQISRVPSWKLHSTVRRWSSQITRTPFQSHCRKYRRRWCSAYWQKLVSDE